MKIFFICGCLEPGRDGVGDYVQRLSEELIRLGHDPFALALKDPYVDSHTVSTQTPGARSLSALRLPASWKLAKRLEQAKLWMDIVNPDIVSIQYVPFSFHVKGLPFSFGRDMKRLVGERAVHVMVHETWVRVSSRFSAKEQLYSFLQRRILKRTLKGMSPLVIHSHLPAYCRQIEGLGYAVKPLPLFSNIPHAEGEDREDDGVFRIGFLSQAEPDQHVIAFLRKILPEINATGVRPQVLLIGGSEAKMKSYKDSYERIPELKGHVLLTGFLKDKDVSARIQTCNIGITPVPRHALGKSGTVAAFLSHGIPVAAPVIHEEFGANDIGFFSAAMQKAIVLEPSIRCFASARKQALAAGDQIALPSVVESFVTDLNII